MTDTKWNFVAGSPERLSALELAQRVAPANCPVLIIGPTGLGKDVLAEDIHQHSARSSGQFVAVNCAALTTTLFESELFGHVRGAYTSAVSAKAGLVEIADTGTLFLDEVGELPQEAQAKLLRFLSKGKFWPVGGLSERTSNVRIISATNRPLEEMLDRGFRSDLFFRLNVVTINIPPLGPQDIVLLAKAFIEELCRTGTHQTTSRETDTVVELASRHSWQRGGARELRNAIERYLVLRKRQSSVKENWSTLSKSDADSPTLEPPPTPPETLGAVLDAMEALVFLAAAFHTTDVAGLAGCLDRSPQAVYKRLQKLRLKPADIGQKGPLLNAMDEVRNSLLPCLPWFQAVLNNLTRS